ncbi:hypothetical protein [Rhizobium lentis]|uniref:Uncharacterized protein n=1 Tax=Rhizobium lentis TaxID=1138194 RepID=A0ABS7IFL6_9HYPH|nr:hypothetical protein [Rhizobium lentis]MBX5089373.1 hypothetical protein [Rhizobium lentis]
MTKLLDLFHQGMDTITIAEHLGGVSKGWTESRVYNAMRMERDIPKEHWHFAERVTYVEPKKARGRR